MRRGLAARTLERLLVTPARTEVERVGDAVLAGADIAERDAHPRLAELRVEDVRAVARAVHPAADDLTWRAQRSRPPGEVLAEGRERTGWYVPRLADPV